MSQKLIDNFIKASIRGHQASIEGDIKRRRQSERDIYKIDIELLKEGITGLSELENLMFHDNPVVRFNAAGLCCTHGLNLDLVWATYETLSQDEGLVGIMAKIVLKARYAGAI